MKTTRALIVLLALAMTAGAAVASLGPATNSAPTGLEPLTLESQEASCPAPNLGNCGSLTLGTCDCDVPFVAGNCVVANIQFIGKIKAVVTSCGHTVDFCQVTSICS